MALAGTPCVNLPPNILPEYPLRGVKGFHLAHLNCRSIPANFAELQIALLDSNITIATVSETWLNDMLPSCKYYVPGYRLMRLDRQVLLPNGETKTAGGVGYYVSVGATASNTELAHLNISDEDIELQWLYVSDSNMKDVVIANLYRPPSGDPYKFIDKLAAKIDNLGRYRLKELYFLGDINIDLSKPNKPPTQGDRPSHKETLLELMKTIGCKQFVKGYTRVTPDTQSMIDLIFSNSLAIQSQGNIHVGVADHDMVYVTHLNYVEKSEPTTFTGRTYRKYSYPDMKTFLLDKSWEILLQEKDPGLAWDIFEKSINEYLDANCPIKTFHFGRKRAPWISDDLIE